MNQIERELAAWSRHEASFTKTFGEKAREDKGFLKVKLEYLEGIYRKCSRLETNPVEKTMLNWLRAGIQRMEKELFPSRAERLMRHVQQNLAEKQARRRDAGIEGYAAAAQQWISDAVSPSSKNRQQVLQPEKTPIKPSRPRERIPEEPGMRTGVHI